MGSGYFLPLTRPMIHRPPCHLSQCAASFAPQLPLPPPSSRETPIPIGASPASFESRTTAAAPATAAPACRNVMHGDGNGRWWREIHFEHARSALKIVLWGCYELIDRFWKCFIDRLMLEVCICK